MTALKNQMERLLREKQQYEEYINTMNVEKEEMVRTHTLETGELRKKVSVLSDHVQRLENQAPCASSSFIDMDNGMAIDAPWNNIRMDDFVMDPEPTNVKQDLSIVSTKKEDITLPGDMEKPAAQGGLLFMLFLVGAFVLSNRGSTNPIPRVPEDVREASATLLDDIFKEAGVNQDAPVAEMAPQASGAAAAPMPSWSAATSAPMVGGMEGVAPSSLGDLADSLALPTEEQTNEQLFGLSASQYNSMSSQDFLQTPVERTTSQGRRNLAETLAAMRSNSKQSSAEVYTRSLLWDQIPSDVVRTFAKLVAGNRVHDVE